MPDLTLAICTWNRARILAGTLDRVAALAVPAGVTWEVVVVNNNSTDDTDAVVAGHTARLPLRYVREPRQGNAFARNAAVAAAQGEWLVFLDDDCRPETDLLAEYWAAAQAHPDVALFGGTMRPEVEGPVPGWVRGNLDLLDNLTARQERPGPNRPLGPAETVYTANLMLRTAVARAFPFDTRLGYVGANRIGGEDIDLYLRVVGAGHKTYWWGTAAVRHLIPAAAVTPAAIARKFVGEGRLAVRVDGAEVRRGPQVFGRPRWAVRRYLAAAAAVRAFALIDSRRWLRAFIERERMRGLLAEVKALRAAGR